MLPPSHCSSPANIVSNVLSLQLRSGSPGRVCSRPEQRSLGARAGVSHRSGFFSGSCRAEFASPTLLSLCSCQFSQVSPFTPILTLRGGVSMWVTSFLLTFFSMALSLFFQSSIGVMRADPRGGVVSYLTPDYSDSFLVPLFSTLYNGVLTAPAAGGGRED